MLDTNYYIPTELSTNVRYGEIGPNGFITPKAMANLLQEVAGLSADSLGFGEQGMFAYGLTWVLSRLVLRIKRLPTAGESLKINSWPSKMDRFGYRGYEVFDQAGGMIVSGGSAWAIMDLATRRLASAPSELIENYPKNPRPCDEFTCRVLPNLNPKPEEENRLLQAAL